MPFTRPERHGYAPSPNEGRSRGRVIRGAKWTQSSSGGLKWNQSSAVAEYDGTDLANSLGGCLNACLRRLWGRCCYLGAMFSGDMQADSPSRYARSGTQHVSRILRGAGERSTCLSAKRENVLRR